MEKPDKLFGIEVEVRAQTAVFFAEIAEAIGVVTKDIMTALAHPGGGTFDIMYSRGIEEVPEAEIGEALLYHQKLVRGPDGILVKFGEEVTLGTADEFFKRADEMGGR